MRNKEKNLLCRWENRENSRKSNGVSQEEQWCVMEKRSGGRVRPLGQRNVKTGRGGNAAPQIPRSIAQPCVLLLKGFFFSPFLNFSLPKAKEFHSFELHEELFVFLSVGFHLDVPHFAPATS